MQNVFMQQFKASKQLICYNSGYLPSYFIFNDTISVTLFVHKLKLVITINPPFYATILKRRNIKKVNQ